MASAHDGGDERPAMTLDEALCFALYSASRAMTGFYRPLLDQLGITYPQYVVMLALWEEDGVSIGTLSERVGLDYGTLSPLLKRLQVAGLVRRERQAQDERSVTVTLTDAGRSLRARADCIPAQVLTATGLDSRSLEALQDTLRRLTATLATAADDQE